MPVSPDLCMVCVDQGDLVGAVVDKGDPDADAEPLVDFGHAKLQDPIVGMEAALSNANGDLARPAIPMPAPKSMTQSEWEKHCVTHLPYHPACPWCLAARRPNVQHRPSSESNRIIPLLVADYCYLKGSDDEMSLCTLVARLYPYKLFFCVRCSN